MPNLFAKRRFRPIDITLVVLLSGWIPSILMALVSYAILSRTLESKIVSDRQVLVKTLSKLVGADLTYASEIISHFQTLPATRNMALSRRPASFGVQEWLSENYFSHPRLDGLFLADADGELIASVPAPPAGMEAVSASEIWKEGAERVEGCFISPIYPRPADQRRSTFIVAAIRSDDGQTLGFVGTTVLAERLSRRLASLDFGEQSSVQVVDQDGVLLADPASDSSGSIASGLITKLRSSKNGHITFDNDFYSFHPVEESTWTAILRQPVAVAYEPVRELVKKVGALAAWLLIGTSLSAWLAGRLARRQIQTAEKIAREELFKKKILAKMPIGIAVANPGSWRFTLANEHFLQMTADFGLLPRERDILEARIPEMRLPESAAITRALERGAPFEARELPVQSQTGNTHFVTISLLRIEDGQQQLQGILFLIEDTTRDITSRKELIEANTAKDEFLALLSHELRNPLSPVLAMVSELEDRADNPPEVGQALEVIRRNVELEARLIDDLLDITRITHGKLQLNPVVIDAHQTVRRALEICEEEILRKGLRVFLDLRATRHHLKADPARLQQVFWNLIKNSVKFTPSGRITIRSCNPEDNPTRLLMEVVDTGIGIEAERLEKIFKPFEQGASITRRFGGLGLGLAISRAMVIAHGGRLTADSAGTGKGASFTVELATVSHAPEPDRKPKSRPPASTGASHRILVVDDHVDTCHGMRLLLQRRGYYVSIAHTVNAALDMAQNKQFDLLISDLGLPDGTGYDLMERLHKETGIPGIALSGFGMESDIERSRRAGFYEHLIKPVDIHRLDAILAHILKPKP